AGREERRGETGERDDAGDAADHDEHLQGNREGETDGEKLAEIILAGDPDAHAAADEHHVQAEDREQADEAELLAEAGDDVVTLGERRDVGAALAETRAKQATVREPVDALDELVSGALRVDDLWVEREQPVG